MLFFFCFFLLADGFLPAAASEPILPAQSIIDAVRKTSRLAGIEQ